MSLRIVFAGTPDVALPTLEALIASGHDVVGVITRGPKRRGRSKALVPSDVGAFAAERGIAICESERPGDPETVGWLSSLNADLGVVVAYGALMPQSVLDIPTHGWINLHFSSLPDLRGAAPVQRALLRGDTELGCSVFQLEAGLDTGPIVRHARFEVAAKTTSGQALELLAKKGAVLVVEAVDSIADGTAVFDPQETGPEGRLITKAPKLEREDGLLTFADSARATVNRARAVTPRPGAWTLLPNGTPMKVRGVDAQPTPDDESSTPGTIHAGKSTVLVKCGDGWVSMAEVAPAGKGWMRAADWWRGARLPEGTRLGLGPDQKVE